jgi:hypothetical protein
MGLGVWNSWPDQAYQSDRYQRRLSAVQEHLAECLDNAPRGSVRVVSICAGDGRDVIGVLGSHRRRQDVAAWLVETSRQSVASGVRQAARAGLENTVHFLNVDATVFETYNNIAPSDILLLCGVWGHVPSGERGQLVRAMTALSKPGGTLIWTRGVSRGLGRLHEVQSLFTVSGWAAARVTLTSDKKWAVVTHRHDGRPQELPASGRLFHFQRSAGRQDATTSRRRFAPAVFRAAPQTRILEGTRAS